MNRYDAIPYVEFGRGLDGLDCWGLVRLARMELFDKPLLPSWSDIQPKDKRALTGACNETVEAHLSESSPKPGAIAAAYRGRLCVHVAVVIEIDGELFALETDEPYGVMRTRLSTFEARYYEVKYYD